MGKKKVKYKTGERGGNREGLPMNSVRVSWYTPTGFNSWGLASTERKAREIASDHWRVHFSAEGGSVPLAAYEKVTKIQSPPY